jgi:hypothetical protein|tara:strand:- start:513 stop:743 length:231 start_codon:yes stop_codon:yes gene_type:complete
MANWKKVIISGSNAELANITASQSGLGSSSISCSGNWFANLPEADNQEILVVYNQTTRRFERRNLNTFPGAPGYSG